MYRKFEAQRASKFYEANLRELLNTSLCFIKNKKYCLLSIYNINKIQ